MSEPISESATIDEALAEHQEIYLRLLNRQAQALRESLSMFDSYVDPREAYRVGSEIWEPIGVATTGMDPLEIPYRTEAELHNIRVLSRHLCLTNEFAICGVENRISYVVGWGHTYSVQAKPGETASARDIKAIESFIKEWKDANCWHARQQEIQRRMDRDGEVFIRFFDLPEGLKVRFVEPWRIRTPEGMGGRDNIQYGIEHEPGDVETPIAYWIEGERVPAEQIQHRKANVDSNWPRGVPTFYPVRKNLLRSEKHLRNMSATVGIQVAIAMVRKHAKATAATVQNAAKALASFQKQDPTSGKVEDFTKYAAGTILDVPDSVDYQFPAQGLDVSKVVAAIQAELRAVASRLVMPEFMLTSDASNANYSSTMVAEGPAVKNFQRLQWAMIEYDLKVINRALLLAGFAPELLASIEIAAEPPTVKTRDELKEAQVRQIDMMTGILSPQTATAESGRDYETEQANIEVHHDRVGSLVRPAPDDGDGESSGNDPAREEGDMPPASSSSGE